MLKTGRRNQPALETLIFNLEMFGLKGPSLFPLAEPGVL